MNKLKRTLALMATLAMATTAFVGCGEEETSKESSTAPESSAEESVEESSEEASEEVSEEASEEASEDETPAAGSTEVGEIDASLATGGDKFTVAAWNADDVPYLLEQWEADNGIAEDHVEFIAFGVGGGDAPERYDQLFSEGTDLDVYFAEADWALKYINDDTKTLALEKLGFTDDNFSEIYSYTDEIGKDKNGVRKGYSWQAAAGGFQYRADLAEEYLGATTPAEMQAQIGNWDDFVTAAKTIAEKSGNTVALADTLGGMWQAFACGRTQPWVVDNKVVLDDFCEKFANTAKELWDCGGITKNGQWTDEWTAGGVNGTCMGYFVSTWGFGGFALDAAGGKDGEAYGKWNVCQGPQQFYWGGTWMVVNPATDNAEDAQSFIAEFACSNENAKKYALSKPEYFNNKAVMEEIVNENAVMNETISGNLGGQNYFAELHENAKKINFNGLITEYDATCKTNFVNAVKETFLDGGASWDETKEAINLKIAEQLPELDWE